MPISQIDLNRVEDASDYLNQKVKALVTEANQREKNLVVSRRELLERERAEMREKTWETLEEGQVREGVVRSIKPFGAFVDVGGVDGLLPIGEVSWVRVDKVEDVIRPGDKVQVKILRIDREARKLTFGLKQLQQNPWDDAEDNYARGATVRGKVTKLMEFGAFVELEPGVEGLIHVSELSPNRVRRIADASTGKAVYTHTFKRGNGMTREEIEYEISEKIYEQLFRAARAVPLTKNRMTAEWNGLTVEIDRYDQLGLTVVEVEFDSEEEANRFQAPPWFGRDIGAEKEYGNKTIWKKLQEH